MAKSKSVQEEEHLFTVALEAAKTGQYLGSRETVDAIVRFGVMDFLSRYPDAKDQKGRIRAMARPARVIARVLLGRNKNYVAVSGWNQPGGIDAFCAVHLGCGETDPDLRMEQSIIKLFNELLEVAEIAGDDDVLEEQVQGPFNDVIEKYVQVFLGVSPAQQDAMMLVPSREEQEEMEDE